MEIPNIVMTLIGSKLIYTFNEIQIKLPIGFCVEIKMLMIKIHMEMQNNWIARRILNMKNKLKELHYLIFSI